MHQLTLPAPPPPNLHVCRLSGLRQLNKVLEKAAATPNYVQKYTRVRWGEGGGADTVWGWVGGWVGGVGWGGGAGGQNKAGMVLCAGAW